MNRTEMRPITVAGTRLLRARIRGWTSFLWMIVCVAAVHAQSSLPVKAGKSSARAGMFAYNVDKAQDAKPRIYLYTLRPRAATCISLAFKLTYSETNEDFIRVFAGEDNSGEPLAIWGGEATEEFLVVESPTLTFEFTRDLASYETAWTAVWRSNPEGKCLDLSRPAACQEVQDLCGTYFHQKYSTLYPHTEKAMLIPTECPDANGNGQWYRIEAAKTGNLELEIIPDNQYDDFDWAIWKADKLQPYHCPRSPKSKAVKVACNYAASRGVAGATGLSRKGSSLWEQAGGNPYCSPLPVTEKEVFYVLVANHSGSEQGYTLRMNETVTACPNYIQEEPEIVRIGAISSPTNSVVRPADQFNKYTKIERLDLNEKMNNPLQDCAISMDLFQAVPSAYTTKVCEAVQQPPRCNGLPMALLMALKASRVPAYAADDNRTPLHYGDILQAAHRMSATAPDTFGVVDSAYGVARFSWWEADRDIFSNFENAIEIISDEVLDKRTGQPRRIIRFVRLVWSDWEGELPDFNIAVFRWEHIQPILAEISVQHPQNDSRTLSIKDMIEMRVYSGITISRSNRQIRTLEEAQFEQNRQLEYQNYLWSH